MTPPDEGPPERPDYKVYRSRRGVFGGGMRKPEVPKIKRPRLPRRDRGDRDPRIHRTGSPWRRRILYGVVGWILLSIVVFAVSAEIQRFKLPGSASDAVSGNPNMITSGKNILVIGTDVRPKGSQEAGAQTLGSASCPNVAKCANTRADTLMVLRAGGGRFRKLSIPRDSFAEIPGQGAQKINGAYAFGGPALEIKTVENFLNIDIDHVMIIDFEGFQNLIDALGGIKVHVNHILCAEINGGRKNGGSTLKLGFGDHVLDGKHALTFARARENSCDSSFSDLDRAANQQRVITGIKQRLTSPLRWPYNFVKAPIIAWAAPRTMIGDLGAFTMPQLLLASVLGGNDKPQVLKPSGIGPGGSLVISQSERRKKVRKLLK